MAELMWGAFVVVAIVAFSFAGSAAINRYAEGQHECNADAECGDSSYCGSDFECHAHKTISKTVISNDYTTPAAIIGLAVVLAAMIIRQRR